MYRSIWKTFNRSVCTLNYFNKRNVLYFRSTGFRFGNFIICGCRIFEIKDSDYLSIQFISAGPFGQKYSLKLTSEDIERRSAGDRGGLSGINILNISGREFVKVTPIMDICRSEPEIGTPVAIIACGTNTDRPYLKSGMISSKLQIRGKDMILIETSFEKGNCGAPLLNAESGKLIGILADGFTPSSFKYKTLKPIIDENINRLKQASGKWTFGDIDPAQVLAANQYMIKHLAREFSLNSHSCSGLAVPASRLMLYLRQLEHNEFFAEVKKN
ncbi:MAG: trypsin-like peptidase domain-containing protein [Bacteroidales bacterium]